MVVDIVVVVLATSCRFVMEHTQRVIRSPAGSPVELSGRSN
jgi:hypothetical protein